MEINIIYEVVGLRAIFSPEDFSSLKKHLVHRDNGYQTSSLMPDARTVRFF